MTKIYAYRARDGEGKPVAGYLDAENRQAAADWLWKQNYFIIDIKPAPEYGRRLELPVFLRRAGAKDIALYCRQLSIMLGAGLPIINCLQVLESQGGDKKLAAASGKLAQKLLEGSTLYQAVRQFPEIFPGICSSVIKTGEESGSLEQALAYLAEHYDREHKLKEKVKSAVSYPAVVLFFSFLVITFMFIFVLPSVTGILARHNVELPLVTRVIMSASTLLFNYWALILATTAAACAGWLRLARLDKVRLVLDRISVRVPFTGDLYKKIIVSRFSRNMAILLRSGVPVLQALDMVKQNLHNREAARAVENAIQGVKGGLGIAQPLAHSGVFPPLLISMVQLGEKTGELEEVLEQVADFYEGEINAAVPRLVKFIEPVLVLMVGGVVAVIAASVLLPVMRVAGTY